MGIVLFDHNQKAYEAAIKLMREEGKAAVIHPTGTGKSFLAFKLAEDYSDAKICWLAPSEYIFRTQLENLQKSQKKSGDATTPENISFYTYAKLMTNEDMIETLHPDYIILDEFHRCGATEWGKSVEKLLAAYPKAKILGLSATNIRYLDNQRDMAEELFDGQIASEMTLGEAIVKGILPTPEYVISLYSYQEEFKKLKKRVSSIKNSGIRKENEEILEQLRRTLENADGLDQIFARHMKKDGKYIVFCADKEHMEEMLDCAKEWFHLVDNELHTYAVSYDNPETSKEFQNFKEDGSSHLKLLYCIDMLNEGVHVEDVDGVILLRPTTSPILYLQQIGRSLSAGSTRQPVIFDIVNNFDSLYSIDSLQKEIEDAFVLLGCTRSERKKFMEHFRIMDETRNVRQLFEQLQKSLSASWDIYYLAAESYYRANGNLRVPKAYVTENGLTLGSWLMTQKRVAAGKIPGKLSPEQIKRLNDIGMEWDTKSDQSFWRGYQALAEYKEAHGDVDVKADYVTEDGFCLGKWVSSIRRKRKLQMMQTPKHKVDQTEMKEPEETQPSGFLTDSQIEKLNMLGMIWDKRDVQWEQNFRLAEAYYKEHGNLNIPHEYRTEDGTNLGVWMTNQRLIYTGRKKGASDLLPEQIKRLNSIGMNWEQKHASQWEEKYALAKRFYEENGHLDVPSGYCVDGVELGRWIASLRLKKAKPSSSGRKLDEKRIRELDEIGMIWNKDAWEIRYQLAVQYYETHGNLRIPANFVTKDRIWLGKWIYEQKKCYRNRTLSAERKERLEKIGLEWERS